MMQGQFKCILSVQLSLAHSHTVLLISCVGELINLVYQAKVLQQYRSKYVLLQYQIKSKLPASVHESFYSLLVCNKRIKPKGGWVYWDEIMNVSITTEITYLQEGNR